MCKGDILHAGSAECQLSLWLAPPSMARAKVLASIYYTHNRGPELNELTRGSTKLQQIKGCLVSSQWNPVGAAGRQYKTNAV